MAADRPVPGGVATTGPALALFDEVVGQPRAIAQLQSTARRPVHAYLLYGPAGSGKRAAARAFAAALLCPEGGCGECNTCRRALAGSHPDLVEVERTGASLSVADAQTLVMRAQRRPLEGSRQVLVATDLHLARDAVPALLKSVEEPPAGTIFVLLADDLPASLETIASRCVLVPFDPVPDDEVARWLEGTGVDPEVAAVVARASAGRIDRARLLATDAGFSGRLDRWRDVPTRLDGTGSAAAATAADLLEAAEGALEPLRTRHAAELTELADQAELTGQKGGPTRRQMDERHKREERRWRTDDLRVGLATLAQVYRDRLVASVAGEHSTGAAADARRVAHQVEAVRLAALALDRNANEQLLLDALMVELSGLTG